MWITKGVREEKERKGKEKEKERKEKKRTLKVLDSEPPYPTSNNGIPHVQVLDGWVCHGG